MRSAEPTDNPSTIGDGRAAEAPLERDQGDPTYMF